MIARIRSSWLSSVLGIGLVLVFIGERLIGSGGSRGVFTGIGIALVLLAFVLRLGRVAQGQGNARRVEALFALLSFGVVVALGLYFLQSDLMEPALGKPVGQAWPKLSVILGTLFPVVLLLSCAPLLLAEVAYASMARAPVAEVGRVRSALYSGLGLACAIIFAFAAVYVATDRDVKADLSYFRTTRPGDSTRKLVEQLEEPIEVSLFFPPANEVSDQVRDYLQDLARGSDKLHLSYFDHDVDRAKAKELGVTGNGAVVFQKGARKEQLVVGQRLESARSQLRTLDEEVHKRLATLTRPRRTLYFVTGHGERTETKEGPNDQRSTIAMFKELLRDQNQELRPLGAGEGLATDVPQDAGAVLIVGPTQPFLREEVDALVRYAQRGGRILLALEPGSQSDLRPLLAKLNVQSFAGELANDQVLIRVTHTSTDNANLAIQTFGPHPAVATLNQLGGRAFVAVFGAGSVDAVPNVEKGMQVEPILRAHKATWNDLDGNLTFDAKSEQRKPWSVAVAASSKVSDPKAAEGQLRAIVTGDAEMFTDATVALNRGNAVFAVDVVRWLIGEDSIAGTVNSEADVPVEHTKKQDVAWFYSTIFGVPALVLGFGVAMTRRRGRKARKSALGEVPGAAPGESGR